MHNLYIHSIRAHKLVPTADPRSTPIAAVIVAQGKRSIQTQTGPHSCMGRILRMSELIANRSVFVLGQSRQCCVSL